MAADDRKPLVMSLRWLAAAAFCRYVAEIQKFQSLNPVPNLELLHLLGNGINSAYNWYK